MILEPQNEEGLNGEFEKKGREKEIDKRAITADYYEFEVKSLKVRRKDPNPLYVGERNEQKS